MFERLMSHLGWHFPRLVLLNALTSSSSLHPGFYVALGLLCLQSPLLAQGDSYAYVAQDRSKYLVELEIDSNSHEPWFEENWDTERFNAYEDITLEFPFKIEFNVPQISAPMQRHLIVTSRYGKRWGKGHHGIDIDLVTGDEVSALFPGKVRHVGYHYGFGKTVIVRHSNGLETVYAHLSEYKVAVNDFVGAGDLLGLGGATGNAQGSHLHLEVRFKGVSINPEYLFDFNRGGSIRSPEIWVTRKWTRPYLHNSNRPSQVVVYTTKEEALEVTKEKSREPKDQYVHHEANVHVVVPGDTMYSIAKRYQLPIDHICKTNDIADATKIKVGQKLVLEP